MRFMKENVCTKVFSWLANAKFKYYLNTLMSEKMYRILPSKYNQVQTNLK